MLRVLIIHENQKTIEKLKRILDRFQDWEIYDTALQNFSLTRLNKIFAEKELHILIFAKNLDPRAILELRKLHLIFPQTIIVYYYSYLKNRQFINLYEEGVSSCIVGTSQQLKLANTLKNLWKNHWKRIPDSLLPASRDDLSARAKKIINYIENNRLRSCNITSLAEYLNISESHCRTEFRRNFGINFRRFKKNLFGHYESVLLFDQKLKPSIICEILNYQNLSGYSRSFKNRHGETLRDILHNSDRNHQDNLRKNVFLHQS